MSNNYKKNNNIDLAIFAFIAFTTWIFKIPQEINLIINLIIVFILILFKTKPIKLVMFSLFSLIGSYSALNFFEVAQKIFSEKTLEKLDYILNLSDGQPAFIVYYIVIIVLAIYFSVLAIKRRPRHKLKVLFPMIGLLLISLISIIWGGDKSVGYMFVSVMIQGFVFYYFIGILEEDIDFKEVTWFATLFLLVVSIQYLVIVNGLVQTNLDTLIKNDPDFTYTITDKFKMYFKYDNKAHIRLWANPNMAAALIGVLLYPSYYKYFIKDSSKLIFLYLPLEVLPLFAIWASMSDGLLFAFGFSIIFILPVILFKNKKNVFYLFVIFLIAFNIFVILVLYLEPKYPEFFTWIDVETTRRFSIYKIGFNELKDPWTIIFGKGLGSSKEILDGNYYYHTWLLHNILNSGIIAGGFTMMIIYKSFVVFNDNKNNKFIVFMMLGSITYLFHGMFDISYDYQFVGLIYYSLLALVEKQGLIEEEVNLKYKKDFSLNVQN